MSAYTDQFDADFAADPQLGIGYTNYPQFKQAVIALLNSAVAILADSGSTSAQKMAANQVSNAPVQWAYQLMPAFLGDSTVLANATSPTDAQMQDAADWIITVLS